MVEKKRVIPPSAGARWTFLSIWSVLQLSSLLVASPDWLNVILRQGSTGMALFGIGYFLLYWLRGGGASHYCQEKAPQR
jgi:hypothetical protein